MPEPNRLYARQRPIHSVGLDYYSLRLSLVGFHFLIAKGVSDQGACRNDRGGVAQSGKAAICRKRHIDRGKSGIISV